MMDENYVTESILNPDQCCPLVKRTACKVNGNIYQVGTTWVGTDICSEYSCELVEGEAIIKVKEKLCDRSCGKGFEYEPTPGSCCGRCIQTHCKLDSGDLILPGSTVQLDNCTKLNCILLDTKVNCILVDTKVNCILVDTNGNLYSGRYKVSRGICFRKHCMKFQARTRAFV
ncbi:intestinal mucin-like protein [Eurytemora carolleeae]|uniref:intestinal mucin-like protein n=1 Tax=Eurytemora carolleeae TaxID=1294199 RepID=UPI000C776FF4|nr:intestinal mucin-like protein [Eurytemora carolleeae]|eukprot:XP_023323884.1 intestinal mucin-like protein [Eurytemora affinis]